MSYFVPCCTLLPCFVPCCPLLPCFVPCCPLLSCFVPCCTLLPCFVPCCPLLSCFVPCCTLLPYFVPCCLLLPCFVPCCSFLPDVVRLYCRTLTGTDISTCLLAPASEFLKKGFTGKYILVCIYLNGQADFLSSLHICRKWHKYLEICKQCNTIKKKMFLFQIIKSMINNTCHSSIRYNLFRARQKVCRASSTCPAWVSSEIYVGAFLTEPTFSIVEAPGRVKLGSASLGTL